MNKNTRRLNLRIFTVANSISYFGGGLVGPFYFLFVRELGGSIENFGIAVGLWVISQSIVAYLAGHYSDKIGRKPFLITSGFLSAIFLFLYTIISSLWQLYIVQILNGLGAAMWVTAEISFLGDLTKKITRGKDVGRYQAFVGLLAGIAMMVGGFIVGKVGLKIIFYIGALIIVLATIPLFWIKEKRK